LKQEGPAKSLYFCLEVAE